MLYSAVLERIYRAIYGRRKVAPVGEGEPSGLVLVADGIGGLNLCGTSLQYAAQAVSLKHEIRIISWGHGFGRWHADLTNVANHESQADEVRRIVVDFRAAHSQSPIFLVGKSGGTGVIVKALERLPSDIVKVAVLLSPALSPTYDLSCALRAIHTEIVVFWSPLDLIVLGLGTRIFGTVDRVRAVSAGLVGFRPPETADPGQYAKLRQVRWKPEMAPTGYLGGHVGPDSPAFLRKYVVPLLQLDPQRDGVSRPQSSGAHSAPIT
jgi:hypothetical protein